MNYHHSGIIALSTVLVIGAIVLVMGIGISLRSVINGNMENDTYRSTTALSLANTCMEYALLSLANNAAYAGNETLTRDGQSCIIQSVVNTGGVTRTVTTSATVNGYTRRIQVLVANVAPPLQISSWQEISS